MNTEYKNELLLEFRSFARYIPETGEILCIQERQGCPTRAGEYLGVWRKKTKYAKITLGGRLFQLSRIIWLHMTGEWPEYNIDHIDGNTRNNAWNNLRNVNQSINMRNARRPSHNSSGQIGVSYRKDINRWRAYTKVKGRQINIGSFLNKENAIKAYINYIEEHPELGTTERHGN